MGFVEEAFSRLFPDQRFDFVASVSHSGRFKPYNASVKKLGKRLAFSLSNKWSGVGEEIVIGLIQHLLIKVLDKPKKVTLNMQLYDDFIRSISEHSIPGPDYVADGVLESSFSRVNGIYFVGMIEKPFLKWGSAAFRRLATYDYQTNTITVSSAFRSAPERLVDYLVFHELLHKKLKFSSGKVGGSVHHSPEFRRLEAAFERSETIESELDDFLRAVRHRKLPGHSMLFLKRFMR